MGHRPYCPFFCVFANMAAMMSADMDHDAAPQKMEFVIRQRGTDLYWSRDGRWDARLGQARRWTNYDDIVTCGRTNNWLPCVLVSLDRENKVVEMRPLDLR
jgi:hypothetical protein